MRARVLSISLLAAAGMLAAIAISSATGQVVRTGNLVVTIDGGISPSKISRRVPTPIALRLSGSIASADGSHVQPLKTVKLEFDRHGHLFTEGLPTCRVGQLQSITTARAKRACGKALIGVGRAEAEIAFPDQAPFKAGGALLIFNGPPRGGKQVLVIHVYAFVPAPTTFVTTAVIGKSAGKYGTTADVEVPTIVAGQGSLISFEARLRKSWTYKGRKRNLLSATCPSGHLYARGNFTFADSTELAGTVNRPCTPTP